MAFLSLPLEIAYEYDVLASDASTGLPSIRRQRFPLAKARKRWKLRYGPTTYADAATELANFETYKGAAAQVFISTVGTGHYGDEMLVVYNSPTAVYVEVDFFTDAEVV